MGDESLIKVIFYFLLVSIGAGLVQMKIPLFGRHSIVLFIIRKSGYQA